MNRFVAGHAKVYSDPKELRSLSSALRSVGKKIVLVPTMGALHAGHLALVEHAKRVPGSIVIVSIFVNPLQFNDPTDAKTYPRTVEADLQLLQQAGVDAVFMPPVAAMYPDGRRTRITPGPLGDDLEGADRPDHFAGMLTVVGKLLAMAQPHLAFFGEKDYQQLVLVRQMVADLNIPVEIRSVPTVREPDGLAMSSRNVLLDDLARDEATALPAALVAGAHAAQGGREAIVEAARSVLRQNPSIKVQYLELRSPSLSEPPESGDGRLLSAITVGGVRLIDNVGVAIGTGFLAQAESDIVRQKDELAAETLLEMHS